MPNHDQMEEAKTFLRRRCVSAVGLVLAAAAAIAIVTIWAVSAMRSYWQLWLIIGPAFFAMPISLTARLDHQAHMPGQIPLRVFLHLSDQPSITGRQ